MNATLPPYITIMQEKTGAQIAADFCAFWKELVTTTISDSFACIETDYRLSGTIPSGRTKRIQHIAQSHRWSTDTSGLADIDWNDKITYVNKGRGPSYPFSICCDLYLTNRNGKNYSFWLKHP